MNHQQAVASLCAELKRARNKHPKFPKDIIHAVDVMMEEAGESVRAAQQFTYENISIDEVKKEITQTGAMCLRILECIEILEARPYQFKEGKL